MHSPHDFAMTEEISTLLRELDKNPSEARIADLKQLLDATTLRVTLDPNAFLDMLFLNAAYNRFRPQANSHGNLYLKHFEIPQIVLFDLLINKFPLVSMSHGIVNDTIKHVIAQGPHSVLIDVGIGRGLQTAKLVELLAHEGRLQTLTVVGVEPSHEALTHAQQRLASVAQQADFELIFKPLQCLMEQLTPAILLAELPKQFNTLAVNSSLAAHHIPTVPERLAFFEMIRQLQPDAFLLTELDSNHMETNWLQRVENAYPHYAAIFSLIDQLYITPVEKNGLKMFFGREISDVVAHPEDQRFERHERSQRWLEYLEKTGFTVNRPVYVDEFRKARGISYRQQMPGHLSMGHKGVNVLSILHSKCS